MKVHLKYVQAFRVGGKRFYYFRRRGLPRVRLPGLPGSAEFMTAYQDALAAQPVVIGRSLRSKPGSVSAALSEYYGSQSFRTLTRETAQKRRTILEGFRDLYGDRQLASLPKEFIVALLDTMAPHPARHWLKAFRHFVRWCESRKLVRNNPTWGIRINAPKSNGYHTWTEDEAAMFEAHHPVGSKARLASRLASIRRSGAAMSFVSAASTSATV